MIYSYIYYRVLLFFTQLIAEENNIYFQKVKCTAPAHQIHSSHKAHDTQCQIDPQKKEKNLNHVVNLNIIHTELHNCIYAIYKQNNQTNL